MLQLWYENRTDSLILDLGVFHSTSTKAVAVPRFLMVCPDFHWGFDGLPLS